MRPRLSKTLVHQSTRMMSHGPSSPIVMESVRPDTILHTITPLAVKRPLIDAIKALIYHKLGQKSALSLSQCT